MNSGALNGDWALRIDTLTAVMLVVVNTVSALVHIYSIGYMSHDPHQPRFFAYLSLFTFAMLMLVTADNLLQMFFGWEGVGLASLSADRLLVPPALRQCGGDQSLHRKPHRRFRLRPRHFGGFLSSARSIRYDFRRGPGQVGKTMQFLGMQVDVLTTDLPPAVHGRHGQVGPVPAPHLAARRHGRPDPGLGPDPCRDHGDGGRVPGGADVAAL